VPDINQALANLHSGNGTMADQATVMTGSATNLVAAAGTGFHLTPEAATALIASCDESLRVLAGLGQDLIAVRETPRLGGTKGALSVSSFTQLVAGDQQASSPPSTDCRAPYRRCGRHIRRPSRIIRPSSNR